MQRKWTVLTGTMATCIALATAVSMADDEKSPLHEIMEKVQSNNTKITKGVRTQIAFAKQQQDVVDAAKELVKLAKEAKPIKDAVKKAKDVENAGEKWDTMMDEFSKESDKFATFAAGKGVTSATAKAAYKKVSATCSACHAVFRVEE